MTHHTDPYDMVDSSTPPEILAEMERFSAHSASVQDAVATEPTIEDLINYLKLIDQKVAVTDVKLVWICNTLEWMTGVFQGLQAVASMMPGKAGKLAAQMGKKVQDNG